MKVCFLGFYAYKLFDAECKATFGGAEVQLFQLAKKLAEFSDCEVSFVVADFGQNAVQEYFGIKVYRGIKLGGGRRLIRLPVSLLALFRILKIIDADIYIQRAAGKETGILALFCKLFKKKFIYMTACELDCNGQYARTHGLDGRMYEFGLKKADRIIVQTVRDQKMVKAVYNRDTSVLRSSYPLPVKRAAVGKKSLLWVGRLEQLKQPYKFIELAQKFSHLKFVMIAPVSTDLRFAWEVKNKVTAVKNLEFIPGVDFGQVNEYFKQAKIFINTSTYEGFPNTFVQAAMYATPVVSLNVNPDNFLNEYACGYCAGGDEEKMAEYVQRLLEDKNDWQQKSNNIYQYAKKQHDIGQNIENLKKIMRETLNKN
jgi:glycosyltransferase involved in cell wall biosynthesis